MSRSFLGRGTRLLFATVFSVGCASEEFTAAGDDLSCDGGACGGAEAGTGGVPSSGGNGGARPGGAGGRDGQGGRPGGGGVPASGGSSGAATGGRSTGGVEGTGGANGSGGEREDAGSGGAEGDAGSGFPVTSLLDSFDRQDGDPGLVWVGSDAFLIRDESLACADCASPALWAQPFGADQEVFATLRAFNADASEINLVLKAQDDSQCEYIEILYSPSRGIAQVDYCTGADWTTSAPTAVFLQPGDRLGGRAHANGSVEIFVNGDVIASVDVSPFPHADGRIGMNGISGGPDLAWDDFGGGDWR